MFEWVGLEYRVGLSKAIGGKLGIGIIVNRNKVKVLRGIRRVPGWRDKLVSVTMDR